jgi:hypothetical protein
MASAAGSFLGGKAFGSWGSLIGGVLGGMLDNELFKGASVFDEEFRPLFGDTIAGRQLKSAFASEGSTTSFVLGRARVPLSTFATESGWRLIEGEDPIPDRHAVNFAVDVCQGPIDSSVVKNTGGGYSSAGFIESIFADGSPIYVRSGGISFTDPNLYFLSSPFYEEVGDTHATTIPTALRPTYLRDVSSSNFGVQTEVDKKFFVRTDEAGLEGVELSSAYIARPIMMVSPPWGPSLETLFGVGQEVTLSGVPTTSVTQDVDTVVFDPNVDGAFFGRNVDQTQPTGDTKYVEEALDTTGHDSGAPGYDYTLRVEKIATGAAFSQIGKAAHNVFQNVDSLDGWEVVVLRLHKHSNLDEVTDADTGAWKQDWNKYGYVTCPFSDETGVQVGVTSENRMRFVQNGATKVYPGIGRDVLLSYGGATGVISGFFSQVGIGAPLNTDATTDRLGRRLAMLDEVPVGMSKTGDASDPIFRWLDPDGNTKYASGFYLLSCDENVNNDGFYKLPIAADKDAAEESITLWSAPASVISGSYIDSDTYDDGDGTGNSTIDDDLAAWTAHFQTGAVPSHYGQHMPIVFGVGPNTYYPSVDDANVDVKGLRGAVRSTFDSDTTVPFDNLYEIDGTDLSNSSEVRDPSTGVGAVMAGLYGQPPTSSSTNDDLNSWVPNRPGRAWAVFENLDLVDYNDSLPNLEAIVAERTDLTLQDCLSTLLERQGVKSWMYDVSAVTGDIEGLTVQEPVSYLETIQMLLLVYRIDCREVNGKLVFEMRENTPTYKIDSGELGAQEGQDRTEPITEEKLPSFRAPKAVQVRFMEDGASLIVNAAYDTLDGYANSDERSKILRIQYPFAMDRRRAKLAARQKMVDEEQALTTYTYNLPPGRIDLLDGDAVLTSITTEDSVESILSRINQLERGANWQTNVSATADSVTTRSLPLSIIREDTGATTPGAGAGDDGGGGGTPGQPIQPLVDYGLFWTTAIPAVGAGQGVGFVADTVDALEPQIAVRPFNAPPTDAGDQTLVDEDNNVLSTYFTDINLQIQHTGYRVVGYSIAGEASADDARMAGLNPTSHVYVSVNTGYVDNTSFIRLEHAVGQSLNSTMLNGIILGTEVFGWEEFEAISPTVMEFRKLRRGIHNTDSPTTLLYEETGELRNAFGPITQSTGELRAFPAKQDERKIVVPADDTKASEAINFRNSALEEGIAVDATYFTNGLSRSIGGKTFFTRIYTDPTFTRRRVDEHRPTQYFGSGSDNGVALCLSHSDRTNSGTTSTQSGPWQVNNQETQSYSGYELFLYDSTKTTLLAAIEVAGDSSAPAFTVRQDSQAGIVVSGSHIIKPYGNGGTPIVVATKIVITGVDQSFHVAAREADPVLGASSATVL